MGTESLQAVMRHLLQTRRDTCFDNNIFLESLAQGATVRAWGEVAAALVRCTAEPGHPLLYVEQDNDAECRVTQYQMPDLRQGILPAYVKFMQGAVAVGDVDLTAPRRRRVFTWDAEKLLQRANYVVRVSLVEPRGGTYILREGTLCMRSQRDTLFGSRGTVTYLNYHGAGLLRCDYDTATWLNIFGVAYRLSSEDRIVITMTLFRFRNIHIGQDCTHRMDRCLLLLEWLFGLAQGASTTAPHWSYITHHIEYIVYMVRDCPCWELFCKFVCALYTPLLRRGSISFAAQEQAATESRQDISRTTVLRILQVLAICRSPALPGEARQQVERALLSVIPRFAYGDDGGSPTAYYTVAFDVSNDSDAAAVSIAMQCLVERADMKTWWTLACIAAAILGISLADTAEELQRAAVAGIHLEHLDEMEKNRWVNMIAPALFAFDSCSTLPFLTLVLQKFESLNTPIAKAILRNKRLVTAIFGGTALRQSRRRITVIRDLLIMQAATFCGDGNLLFLMRNSVAEEAPPERQGGSGVDDAAPARAATTEGGGSGGGSSSSGVGNGGVPCRSHPGRAACVARSSSIANAIAAVETNCVWLEYCCEHYDAFLSKRFSAEEPATPRWEMPAEQPVESDSVEHDGVST
ncbi:puromycin-sensitive aminopeptidase-like protein [Trypanosoma conorhini]|uniref:Puromycin-sensitive aminopeptidase-like protein n=1 Tax=Trypanosoma conorhini TaxID=83891 RepID=A0A3R7NZK5_9TRYP|nr:puromycin-sensitive aminopeptidase-like protein [Trypanosoma conorhini]RNF26357.1 puromycin-sensitive aminopeptidase-like protein [Trypanosoma conorhini]